MNVDGRSELRTRLEELRAKLDNQKFQTSPVFDLLHTDIDLNATDLDTVAEVWGKQDHVSTIQEILASKVLIFGLSLPTSDKENNIHKDVTIFDKEKNTTDNGADFDKEKNRHENVTISENTNDDATMFDKEKNTHEDVTTLDGEKNTNDGLIRYHLSVAIQGNVDVVTMVDKEVSFHSVETFYSPLIWEKERIFHLTQENVSVLAHHLSDILLHQDMQASASENYESWLLRSWRKPIMDLQKLYQRRKTSADLMPKDRPLHEDSWTLYVYLASPIIQCFARNNFLNNYRKLRGRELTDTDLALLENLSDNVWLRRSNLGIQPGPKNADSFNRALPIAFSCIKELVRRDTETPAVEELTKTIRDRVREYYQPFYNEIRSIDINSVSIKLTPSLRQKSKELAEELEQVKEDLKLKLADQPSELTLRLELICSFLTFLYEDVKEAETCGPLSCSLYLDLLQTLC